MRTLLALVVTSATVATPAFAQDAAAAPAPPVEAAAAAPAPPTPTATDAQPGTSSTVDAVVETANADDKFPLHASLSLTQNLGSGTFYVGTAFNPTLFTTMELAPSLVLGDFVLSAAQGLALEWTQSDSTTYANQVEIADTRFGVRWGGLRLDDAGLSLSLSAGYTLPISAASRFYGSIGGLGAGARGAWTWKQIGLTVSSGANVGGNVLVPALAGDVQDRPFTDRTFGVTNAPSCLLRDGEAAGVACVGTGPAFRYGLSLGTSWTTLDGALTTGAELVFGQAYDNYWGADDELRADDAIAGPPFSPYWSGTLSVSWTPVEWFTLTGGTASSQGFWGRYADTGAAANPNNFRWPTFPFWDFTGNGRFNTSTLFVDTTFSI